MEEDYAVIRRRDVKEFHNPQINPAAKELIRRKLLDALEERYIVALSGLIV